VASNLGLELAHLLERPTALVDLNLEFGDIACAFDCEPTYSVADLCRSGSELDRTMVEAAMHVLPCNVHLLARPAKIQDAPEVAPEAVEKLLVLLSGVYSNVVVDLPRGFNFFSATAVERADLVLIVAQLTVPSIRNARRIYELLRQMNANMDNVEIVLNRYKADFQRITREDVERHFRRPVFGVIPNDYRQVAACLDFGHPILANSPKSPARVAIHEMAKKIAAEFKSEEASSPQRKGLFGRLLGKKEPVRG
jgi:pilus assembly protein CpaE